MRFFKYLAFGAAFLAVLVFLVRLDQRVGAGKPELTWELSFQCVANQDNHRYRLNFTDKRVEIDGEAFVMSRGQVFEDKLWFEPDSSSGHHIVEIDRRSGFYRGNGPRGRELGTCAKANELVRKKPFEARP